MGDDKSVGMGRLILVPAVVTLAVTLLRLIGELQGWSPRFFSRAAGGAGAIVGIVWLVFVFGAWFAVQLWKRGERPPSMGGLFGYAVLGLAVVLGLGIGAGALGLSQNGQFLAFVVGSFLGVVIAMRAWPALAKTLLA